MRILYYHNLSKSLVIIQSTSIVNIKFKKNSIYVNATVALLTDHEWRWFFSKYIMSVPLLNPRTLRLFTRYFYQMRAIIVSVARTGTHSPQQQRSATTAQHTTPQGWLAGWRGSIARRRMWNKAYVITPGSSFSSPTRATPHPSHDKPLPRGKTSLTCSVLVIYSKLDLMSSRLTSASDVLLHLLSQRSKKSVCVYISNHLYVPSLRVS